jgi:uncharacterized lipoprotein YmbA
MKTFASNPCARRSLAFALAVFLLGAAGCSSLLEPRPDPSRFYLLTPQPPAGEVSPASAGGSLSVGLGPITMPAYLDRPQTVTRVGANELRISEVDRWAEPLAKNFARVLGQDLAARLDGARLHDYPWYNSTAIDYQIEVAVHRFETDASGQNLLAARWTILDGRDKRMLDAGNTMLAQSSAPGDVAASTAALSRIVAEFSEQIAATLRRLGEQRQAAAEAIPPRPRALLRAGTPSAR